MRLVLCAGALAAMVAFSPDDASASDWSGFYVGGNAGYDWGSSDVNVALSGFYTSLAAPIRDEIAGLYAQELDPSGKSLGAQLGFNQTFGGGFVVGLEADYASLGAQDVERKGPVNLVSSPGNIYRTQSTVDGKHLLAAKAKIGFGSPGWLVYATGGWAIARVEGSTELSNNSNFQRFGSDTEWLSGFVYGAGVEAKIATDWSLRVEYLRGDFGDFEYQGESLPFSAFATFGFVDTAVQEFDLNLIRVGVNFHF